MDELTEMDELKLVRELFEKKERKKNNRTASSGARPFYKCLEIQREQWKLNETNQMLAACV